MKSGDIVLIVGKRETGKTTIVKDILYHNQDVSTGTVISGTEGINKEYQSIMQKYELFNEYRPEIIENVVKLQQLKTKHHNSVKHDLITTDPKAFLVFDNCMFDRSWTKDKNIKYIFQNAKNISETLIITESYCVGVPSSFKTNTDYVFILRENMVNNRRRLYETYAGVFQSFEIFCQVMDQRTDNYECLVVNHTSKSTKLEDRVFWYKADLHDTDSFSKS